MIDSAQKTILYKRRNFGQRLSASVDFIQKNAKILYKNMFIVILVFSALTGFFMKDYFNAIMGNLGSGLDSNDTSFIISILGMGLISLIGFIAIYAITCSYLKAAGEGKLSKESVLGDFKESIFSNAGRIFITGLIVFVISLIVMVLISVLLAGVIDDEAAAVLVACIILMMIVVVFAPSLYLCIYPACFEDISIIGGLRKGFRLGFNFWGTTFLTAMLCGLIVSVIQYLFLIPLYICMFAGVLLSTSGLHFLSSFFNYIASFIASFGMYFSMPFLVICIAFQYFSIREEQEGISLSDKIKEFENL